MPLPVGVGLSGALMAGVMSTPKSKNDIQDTINRLERQRDDYKKQNEENYAENTDKKIKDLENRINNLRSRMDKAEAKDDGKCETCENRRYQDGSDDPGVSFKSASKISGNAEAAVRGHEQEHVTRNRAKAERENKEIVYQSVVIKHAICPECGKNYVAGGETTTVTRTKPQSEISDKDGFTVDLTNDKHTPKNGIVDSKSDDNENAVFGGHTSKQDERFNVGLYDREREIGKFFNVVA